MTKVLRLFLNSLLFLIFFCSTLWAEEPKRVLFISSYHPAFPTFFQQIDGVKSVFKNQPILLDIEFMDSKRFPDRATFDVFYRALSAKLSNLEHYDAIIVADDNALSFALEYQQDLFPESPIVFLGVNDINLALHQNANPYITGVIEAVSMQETLELILKLHPSVQRIVALVDDLPSGQGDLKHFYQFEKAFPSVTFSELSLVELTFDAFTEQLKTIGENDVILLLSAYQDTTGKTLLFHDSLELIRKNLGRPIYHLWQHGIGQGVLGGKVISHRQQGIAAAEIVLEIFAGKPVDEIPVSGESPNHYLFDYKEMTRFGVKQSSLPVDSLVYNEPQSFYRIHRTAIWILLTVFSALSLLIMAMFINILQRKATERALGESEERLRELIEQSPIGLILCAIDGSIVSANSALTNIIGYRIDETLKLSCWDITPKKYAQDEQQRLRQLEATGRHHLYEKEYRHKAGHLVPVLLNSMIVVRDDKRFIWSSVEDITGLKKAEAEKKILADQLRQSQKMEAIGTLAGGVAHDFNNILSAILGYTELNLCNPNCDDQSRKNLSHVLTAAGRARELVKQILMFSRKSTTQQDLIKIHLVVEEAITLLRKTIPTSIPIRLDIDRNTGSALADETQIHQVVMNLSINAYHSMQDNGGKIDISFKPVDIDNVTAAEYPNLKQGRYGQLTISDNGSGMSPEIMSRIFDPFFTTKDQGEGTGMGLSVVLGIVKSHDGAIGVKSNIDEGTSFTVFFPLVSDAISIKTHASRDSTARHGNEHILFVDDEAILVELGRETLESFGYKVTATNSPIEAFNFFQSAPNRYDLIITDQTMPGMTGDLLAQKAMQIRADIPVIVCTGYSATLDSEKADTIGIKTFLLKPLDADSLLKEVRNILDKDIRKDEAAMPIKLLDVENPESESILLKKDFLCLPSELRRDLEIAVNSLDPDEIDVVIANIRQVKHGLGVTMQKLAKDFRFDHLKALFKS